MNGQFTPLRATVTTDAFIRICRRLGLDLAHGAYVFFVTIKARDIVLLKVKADILENKTESPFDFLKSAPNLGYVSPWLSFCCIS